MNDLRNDFPALFNQTYFNTASSGLMHKGLFEWRNALDKDYLNHGADYIARKQLIEKARADVARFFSASIDEVALVPNFSFGFNTLVDGISSGKKVLLLADEYPSTSWPIVTRDFVICIASLKGNIEENILRAIEKHKPQLFVFSMVQWLSGIKLSLAFLKHIKERYPALLLLSDGTQYLGTEKFNFNKSPIDVIGASGYKWMLAGFGNGFMLTKKEVQSQIHPKTIGFNSAQTFESKPQETSFIKHFEPGHQAAICFGSVSQSIKYVESIGIETIENQIKDLTTYAKEKFQTLGILQEGVYEREHSSIFNLNIDLKMYQKLKQHKVNCALRGGGVRVSFHFYNTKEEIDAFCKLLK